MGFLCKACGRQRAGSPGEGFEVCDACRPTQAGRATLLLRHFEAGRVDYEVINTLDEVLDQAQNGPPDGECDDSLTENRWAKYRALVSAARAFNEAMDNATLATFERR